MPWLAVLHGRPTGCARLPRALRAFAVVLLLTPCLVGTACSPSDPARAAAQAFIDRYYVEIDLPAAYPHAVGFARAKLEREQKLLEGIGAPESAGKPLVSYVFLQENPGSTPGHRGFLYELTIRFGEGPAVVRKSLVTVREESGSWRVANFQEID